MTMTASEISLFEVNLNSATRYLEYGTGGSTKLAAKTNTLLSITSVESDPTYLSEHVIVDESVAASARSRRLTFLIVNIGSTGKWGHPRDRSKAYLWPNYALCPYLHGHRPDLILIDGRFRVACGIVAALHVPEATVLIHDYTNRPQYHVLEQFYDIERTVDTLVQCRRKATINGLLARRLLKKYLYSPDDQNPFRVNQSRDTIG